MLSVLTTTIAGEQCSFCLVSVKSDLLLKSLADTLQNISKHPEQQHCPQLRSVSLLSQTVKFGKKRAKIISCSEPLSYWRRNQFVSVCWWRVCVCALALQRCESRRVVCHPRECLDPVFPSRMLHCSMMIIVIHLNCSLLSPAIY